MNRRLISLLALASFNPTALLAADRSPASNQIPMEINYSHHLNIYEKAKQASESQREKAEKLALQSRSLNLEIGSLKANLENNENKLEQNKDEIKSLQLLIPRLQKENERLSNEAIDLEAKRSITSMERGLDLIKRDRKNTERAEAQAAYEQTTASLQLNQAEIANNDAALFQAEAKKSQLIAERETLDTQNIQLNQFISSKSNELRSAEAELDQVTERANVLRPVIERLSRDSQQIGAIADQQAQTVREVSDFLKFTEIQLIAQRDEAAGFYSRRDHLSSEIHKINKLLKELDKRLKEINRKKKVEKKKRESLAVSIVGFNSSIPALKLEITNIQNEIDTLNGQITPLEESIKENEIAAKALRKELADLIKNAATDPVFKALIAKLQKRLDSLNGQIEKKKSSIATQLATLDGLNGGLAAMEAELSIKVTAKNNAAKKLNRIKTFGKDKRAAEKKIQTLSSEISTLNNEITALKTKMLSEETKIKTLQAAVRKLRGLEKQADKKQEEYYRKYKFSIGGTRNKYKKKYKEQKALRDKYRVEIAAKNAELAPLKVSYRADQATSNTKTSSVETKSQEVITLTEKVAELTEELGNITQTAAELQIIVNGLNSEIAQSNSNIKNVKSEIAKTNASIAPVLTKIASLEAQAEGQKKKIDQATANPANIPSIAGEVKELRKQIKALESKIAVNKIVIGKYQDDAKAKEKVKAKKEKQAKTDKKTLDAQVAELKELKGKIAPRDKRIAEIEERIQSNSKEMNKKLNRRDRVVSELRNLEFKIAQLDEQFVRQDQFYRKELEKLQSLDARYQELVNQANQANNDYNAAIERSAQLSKFIPQATTEIQNANNQLSSNINRIGNNVGELNQVVKSLDGLYSRKNALNEFRVSNLSRQSEQLSEANELQKEVDQFDSQIAGLDLQLLNLNSQITNREDQVANNQSDIKISSDSIISLSTENQTIILESAKLTRKLIERGSDLDIVNDDFAVEDEKAKKLETITANKKSIYDNAQELYKTREANSIESGRSQGAADGQNDGDEEGAVVGNKKGSKDGSEIGKAQGEITGYLAGLTKGLILGKKEGYAHGSNVTARYEEGFEAGYAQGKNDVYRAAIQITYPNVRAEQKDINLSKRLVKEVELDNTPVIDRSEIGLGEFQDSRSELEISNSDIEWVNTDGTESGVAGVRKKMDGLRVRLKNLKESFSQAQRAAGGTPRVDVNADEAKANCNDSYQLFVEKCKAAYSSEYESSYEEEFKRTHKNKYLSSLSSSRRTNFEANEEVKFDSGKTEAYEVAYSKWDLIGAEDAQKDGYKEGKRKGKSENEAKAIAQETNRAKADENRFFTNNPVIRTSNAKITSDEKGFYPSSTGTLSLRASNFGGQASKLGQVRVQLKAKTRNVSVVEEGARTLISIPAKTKAQVTNIAKIKVGSNVKPGEAMVFDAFTFLPSGEIQKEKITVKGNRHVEATMSTSYDKTVKVKSWGFTGKHKVEVKINNTSNSPLAKAFTVVLESDVDGVKIIDSNIPVDLTSAASGSTTVRYSLSKKNRKKTVTLKVKVYYGSDRLISEETISVKVK